MDFGEISAHFSINESREKFYRSFFMAEKALMIFSFRNRNEFHIIYLLYTNSRLITNALA